MSDEIIPFAEANVGGRMVTLIDGRRATLPEGREVIVWKVKDDEGGGGGPPAAIGENVCVGAGPRSACAASPLAARDSCRR